MESRHDAGKSMFRDSEGAIQKLPQDVIVQLKSSVSINSLGDVVLQLLKNSFDASATKVEIDVDFRRGGCTIQDNGLGISPHDLNERAQNLITGHPEPGRLGRAYFTSKYGAGEDIYGRHGTFLASLTSLALVKITSRHHRHYSTNTVTFHRTQIIDQGTERALSHDRSHYEHGTVVTVRDLFGNMPVRVKQRAALDDRNESDRQWKGLQNSVVALAIAWKTPVNITMKEIDSDRRLKIGRRPPDAVKSVDVEALGPVSSSSADLQGSIRILNQSRIAAVKDVSSWIPISASSETLSILGSICLQPAPSKSAQFISVGINPLSTVSGHNELFDEINRIFDCSTFGTVEGSDLDENEIERRKRDRRFKSDSFTIRQLRSNSKGIDRWPMFVFRINARATKNDRPASEVLGQQSQIRAAIELLSAMAREWLSSQGFRLQDRRKRKPPGSRTLTPNPEERQGAKTRHQSLSPTPPTSKSLSANNERTVTPYTGIRSFNQLSRIKSGRAAFYETAWLSKLPQNRSLEASITKQIPSLEERGSLKRAQLVDRQTETPQEALPASNLAASSAASVDETGLSGVADDEFILWEDPVTKEKFHLNARTGAAVRPGMAFARSRSSNDVLSSTSARLSAMPVKRLKRCRTTDEIRPSSAWLKSFLESWENPVFKSSEQQIRRAFVEIPDQDDCTSPLNRIKDRFFSSGESAERIASLNSAKLSKHSLLRATIIAQVDRKFILIKVPKSTEEAVTAQKKDLLVLVDQHAADERIKVEGLLSELCSAPKQDLLPAQGGSKCRFQYTLLSKPITFQMSEQEAEILKAHASHFADWSILVDVTPSSGGRDDRGRPAKNNLLDSRRVQVRTVPTIIAARVESDSRLLINLIRSEIWRLVDKRPIHTSTPSKDPAADEAASWLKHLGSVPPPLLDLANSRACRSACMFNDALELPECENMIRDLAECAFPFICAHGRPSMVPLVSLEHGDGVFSDHGGDDFGNGQTFVSAFSQWRSGEAASERIESPDK